MSVDLINNYTLRLKEMKQKVRYGMYDINYYYIMAMQ